ncbi:uncharacterized protein [Dermacentor albipictus]|uniref:uncharacterized protein n=1 Tax=Dermacentor albipictus TaxID=60249 RepID=UPI0038FC1CBD
MGLNLITSALYPTRMGNSVSRDTTPDLTLVLNTEGATWQNTGDDLGSDHYIVEMSIAIALKPLRKRIYTDWDAKFRQVRKERTDKPATLEQWSQELIEYARNATTEIETDIQTIGMDAKLAHMLEAKRSILQRWCTKRLNRRLRKKVALLNKDIEHHCVVLSNQQWDEVGARVDGSMTSGKTWNLLKHLLNKGQTRSSQTKAADKIAKRELKNNNEQEFMARLSERCMPLSSSHENEAETPGPPYTGTENPDLDEPFTVEEITTVLQNLNGTSAPSPDGISNKALRNLDEDSVRFLAERINQVWASGRVPPQWKNATMVLIPKPNKLSGVENKASDNLSHQYIVDTISDLNLGARFHSYAKSFLDNRTATLRFADLSTETLLLESRGTPQGSVISPMLVNLTMAGLAEKLGQIHGLEHTIYADDITMWVSKGTPGMVQDILQEAVLSAVG